MRGLSAFAFSVLVSAAASTAVAQQTSASAAAGFAPAPAFFPRSSGEPAPVSEAEAPLYGGLTLAPIDSDGRAGHLVSRGLANYQENEVWVPEAHGSVGRYRYTTGSQVRGADPMTILRPDAYGEPDAYDISYTRGWPGAVRFNAGDYALDVTPHAGVGMTNQGGAAEAGATVRLGADLDDALENIVKDGKSFGDKPRWYLFAAASGRAVGYNFLNDGSGLTPSGVSTDEGSFIGDAQAGLAWRRGDIQASFGYVHREIKAYDEKAQEEVLAFQLSIKPDW
ncbi:lipid A-modifier LpxR family protein [Caulobacter sp. 17J65-9]|uniref:lipid A-modifier LpxR family protein n=1 Tax=Caulobacter sp. 17J65-9 TaxID=2709382 RepID=UPI0013C55D27|nr:lipid A deacylase LpxR family protein [Caulobacter sp. 17J65-9]